MTSGPIPKFVSYRRTLVYELRNLRTTSNSMTLVPLFEPEVRDRICRTMCANFGFGALVDGDLGRLYHRRPKRFAHMDHLAHFLWRRAERFRFERKNPRPQVGRAEPLTDGLGQLAGELLRNPRRSSNRHPGIGMDARQGLGDGCYASAGSAGSVFHYHLLPKFAAHLVGGETAAKIGGPARRQRHDKRVRTRRKTPLRLPGGGGRRGKSGRKHHANRVVSDHVKPHSAFGRSRRIMSTDFMAFLPQ